MEKVLLFFLNLTIFSTQVFAEQFRFPRYQKHVLTNGLTIYLLEQHEVPLINIKLLTKTGSVNDLNKPGLSYLTMNSLVLGSKNLSKQEIENQLDFIGASWDVEVSRESSSVNISFAKDDTEKVLGISRQVFLNPVFPKSEFIDLKKRSISQLDQSYDSPNSVISNYFYGLMFDQHPYGSPPRGTPASLEEITVKDVERHYTNYIQPQSSFIIVAGDFDTQAMLMNLQKRFDGWKNSTELKNTSVKSEPITRAKTVLLVDKPDAKQSTFYIGGKSVPRKTENFVQADLINTLLGGRFTSWLNQELRVKTGLTYGAISRFESHKKNGVFYISSFTATENTKKALNLAIETYKKLFDDKLSNNDISSASAYIKGQFPPDYETSSQLADFLAEVAIFNISIDEVDGFYKAINSFPKETTNLVKKFFPNPDDLSIVVIGNAKAIRKDLKNFGKLVEVKLKNKNPTAI